MTPQASLVGGRRVLGLALLVGGAATTLLRAQDTLAAAPFRLTADFGFVATGGNTDLMTLSLAEKTEYAPGARWTLRHSTSWVYGETDGERSANQLLSGLRIDFGVGDGFSIHAGVNYDYNLFAGVKRRFEEQAGLGFQVVDTERHRLRVEAGASLFQETGLDDLEMVFLAGRAATDYRFHFTEKAYFQHTFEAMPNFEDNRDYRLNSEAILVAPFSSVLALKVGYLLRYRGEPPEGFGSTDTTFRTAIQVTL